MASLSGLIGRQTAGTGMTAKGSQLSWGEEDNNFLLLLNFVNLIGRGFNPDGTLNIQAPASSQIVSALLPFLGSVGQVIWRPCEMSLAKQNPDQNGAVWVEGNGQALLQVNYPALFAEYGTKFNQAGDDPANVFRVPDLTRRVLMGRGAAGQEITGTPAAGGGFLGEETHKLLSSESGLPAHDHTIKIPSDTATDTTNALVVQGDGISKVTLTTDANAAADAANAHNNMQPSAIGVFYILAGYKLSGAMLPAS